MSDDKDINLTENEEEIQGKNENEKVTNTTGSMDYSAGGISSGQVLDPEQLADNIRNDQKEKNNVSQEADMSADSNQSTNKGSIGSEETIGMVGETIKGGSSSKTSAEDADSEKEEEIIEEDESGDERTEMIERKKDRTDVSETIQEVSPDEPKKPPKEKFITSETIKTIGVIIVILAILLILTGIFTFMTAVPSMTIEKLKAIVQDMWKDVNGHLTKLSQTDVNDKNLIKAAQYLYDMGYDIEGYGLAEKVEFEKDSNGNANGTIKKLKSSYLTAYLAAEEKTFLIRDNSVNLKSVFSSVTPGKITDGLSSWGSGLINLEDGLSNGSIDRSNNVLKVKHGGDDAYLKMKGWGGRYGKPFELLLTLHLSTMAPDFAYEVAYNPALDTKINIGYKNTVHIKTVTNHWFRNVYFDTEGKSVTYSVVDEDDELARYGISKYKDDGSEKTKTELRKELKEKKKEIAQDPYDEQVDTQYQYVYEGGKRQLKTATGSINVYESEEGSYGQDKDAVRGVTNATTKKLFRGKYFIYDGTTKTAESIRAGKVAKKEISPNTMSLQAFSILESETSIDSQLIYRDLKELMIELDYFSYIDFKKDIQEVLEWPIPEYKYYIWPYTLLEKQVLDYGTAMLCKASVDAIKEKYGLERITLRTPLTTIMRMYEEQQQKKKEKKGKKASATVAKSAATAKAANSAKVTGKFSPITQQIVEAHINDFDVDNFRSKMASYGGYESYLKKELGGVFATYAGEKCIANVSTIDEFQEVAEYVYGLMTIYGFDYCNGDPGHYGIWRANDGGTSDGFYKGRTNGAIGTCAPRDIDKICAGKDSSGTNGTNMTVNCNWGVDYFLFKCGLFSKTDNTKPSSSCDYGTLIDKYHAKVITNVRDLKVGDVMAYFRNPISDYSNHSTWSGWGHAAIVGEIDEEEGTITFYESGHFFTNSGNFKNVRSLDSNDLGWAGWVGLHLWDLDRSDELIGFEPGLDVIAMGDGKLEKMKTAEHGEGVRITLSDEKIGLKGYGLYMLGFDVTAKNGNVKKGDVIGTTLEGVDMCYILLDLEKANVENVENYVKKPKKNSSTIVIGDDYDVSDPSLFITDIDDFKMMFAKYKNIVANAHAFLDMQEKYQVNAVFAACVTIAESGGGESWAAISPSTHNWFSIKGSYRGHSYVSPTKNKGPWRSYPSFEAAVYDFGDLIANGKYYYRQGKKTVRQIGPTYCSEHWADTVVKLMTTAFQKVV